MKLRRFTAALLAVTLAIPSCVEVNKELGSENLDKEYLIDIYTVDMDLTETRLQMADSISGYSTSRLTVGAVRADVFGETVRGTAPWTPSTSARIPSSSASTSHSRRTPSPFPPKVTDTSCKTWMSMRSRSQ